MEQANYLDQAIHLLKEGTCHKRLRDGAGHAEKVLREADRLIDKHDLPKPWPQLVSYRLAHVLLRYAETTENLEEIDQLLSNAVMESCLGPLPRLYRLAVLSRLGKKPETMKPVFNALIEQIGDYTHGKYGGKDENFDRLTSLQNNFFNMLELAAYFTGYPYEGFEGRGLLDLGMGRNIRPARDPFADLYSNMEEWRLVGTVPGLATTAYPGELALKELEDRMEKEEIKPPCVAFKISADRTVHHWNFNLSRGDNGFNWIRVPANANYILFLSSVLYYRQVRTRADLLMRLFNDDANDKDTIFRSWKTKCAKKIAEELKDFGSNSRLTNKDIFFDDSSVDSSVPEVQPGIAVLGTCERGFGR